MSKKQREISRTERAAAIRREQAVKDRNRRLLITLGIVVVLSAVIAAGVIFTGGKDEPQANGPDASLSAEGQALVMGPKDAEHTVVVYEDFLCPYCREFESASRSFLEEYAAKGTARVEYRPFHLLQDPYSLNALTAWSAVLEKGSPEQALKFHTLLFENQPYEADPDKPGMDELIDLAEKAGVEDSSVVAAMKQENKDFVDAADLNAKEAGVQGTPTVFLDGKQLEGGSISEMADNLEAALAGR